MMRQLFSSLTDEGFLGISHYKEPEEAGESKEGEKGEKRTQAVTGRYV